jgi:uncharacterized protein (DUF305 family)
MRKTRSRTLAAGLLGALLGALALAAGLALASGDDGSLGAHGPFIGTSDPNVPYDLRFIDEMTMHHQGAVMSARMMIADSRRPELRELARRITADQQRQIGQMAAWRRQWYPTARAPAMGGMGGMEMMGGMGAMGGMGGMEMMRSMGGSAMGAMGGMGGVPRDASDRMFLRMMVPHHALAVDMGRDAVSNASHPELKRLAQEITDGQSREITEMEGYLKRWYGEDSTRGAAGPMQEMMKQMMGGRG